MFDETSHPPTHEKRIKKGPILHRPCPKFFVCLFAMGFSPSLPSEKTRLFPYLFPIIISSKQQSVAFKDLKCHCHRFERKIAFIYIPKSSAKEDNSKKNISSGCRLTSQSLQLIYQGTRLLKSCQISCSSVTWKKNNQHNSKDTRTQGYKILGMWKATF